MAHFFETLVDRKIREALERGEFENLRGAGKPLPGHGDEYDEDWYVKELVDREQVGGAVLPGTLALRKELEDLPETLARVRTEAEVRRIVAELNERIADNHRGLLSGPPTIIKRLDAERIVREWRGA
ncbi:DnaJ family domain-containing protein [Catenuloplanes atrovinosus]|uniref:DnaJ homologue subfamily C member 28 conserved domain-containing protein n=1 Tax=Catenuloplanes atrovinosus TaxID=137266 RepID=A0AAE3YJ77_9ACTN|nr:DUF1992 domain-containing protein [Catenuloplanes atrovinosus]MDR7274490.1 hypothetical protein [Catenuloplanes atrovinosus]